MRAPKYLGIAWVAGSTIWPLTALAQAEDLRRELGRCAVMAEISVRVACYDSLAQQQQIKPATRQPSLVTTAPESLAAKREGVGQSKTTPSSAGSGDLEVLGKVTSLKETQPNKLQITLGNGQVWQQTVGKPFFIRADDSVRLSPSSWGQSYRLTVDGHPDFIQVRRLR